MKKFINIISVLAIAVSATYLAVDPTSAASMLSQLDPMTVLHPIAVFATVPVLLNPRQLEKEAMSLSHFGGNGGTGNRMNFYTGMEDDLLSFEGDIASFAQELDDNLEKQFTITIVNANAANRVPVLFAGYYKGNATLAPGQVVEGAFNDRNAAAGLTGATAEAKSIEELFLFLNNVPTRLLALKLQSTVPGQLNQNLTYNRNNPFKQEETKTIRPKNWVNQNSYQNDQVVFPVKQQLDALSFLFMPIVGTSTATLTYYFGASLNIIAALERKAQRAEANIKIAGAQSVIANQRALAAG